MFSVLENLKIKETIYRYRDNKKEHPDFNEDQLCRLVLVRKLKENPPLYNLRDNSQEKVDAYMKDIFDKELTLKYICGWLMEQEYPKYNFLNNSNDINGWKTRNKDLESRIEVFMNKTPGI